MRKREGEAPRHHKLVYGGQRLGLIGRQKSLMRIGMGKDQIPPSGITPRHVFKAHDRNLGDPMKV